MTRAILITTVFIFSFLLSNAQVQFEKGYVIFPNGNKTECLIKNKNWLRTPEELTYKLNENDDPVTVKAADVAEFGVDGGLRYVSADVKIDYTPKDPNKVGADKFPNWVKERLFLKVIVDAKASLYSVSRKDVERFFFKSESNDTIRQLIYKPYKESGTQIRYNKTYQAQLTSELSCDGLSSDPADLDYTLSSLRQYFNGYNSCRGVTVEEAEVKRKSEFHLTLAPGFDNSEFLVESSNGILHYQKEASFRLGVELEFILPFNSRKWAVFIEPTYQSYKTSVPFVVNVTSMEIPAGARHYIYLGENSKIFLNAAAVLDFPVKLEAQFQRTVEPAEASKSPVLNFAFGAGFKYSRFGVEGRYYTSRSRLDENSGRFLVQQKTSIILSVRLF